MTPNAVHSLTERPRPIIDPRVTRTIHLATVAGRRFSPAVATFIKAIDRYQWPERAEDQSEVQELHARGHGHGGKQVTR